VNQKNKSTTGHKLISYTRNLLHIVEDAMPMKTWVTPKSSIPARSLCGIYGQQYKYAIRQGYTNTGHLIFCRSSVWNALHVTFLTPRNLKWLLDFWENLWTPVINDYIFIYQKHVAYCHYFIPIRYRPHSYIHK